MQSGRLRCATIRKAREREKGPRDLFFFRASRYPPGARSKINIRDRTKVKGKSGGGNENWREACGNGRKCNLSIENSSTLFSVLFLSRSLREPKLISISFLNLSKESCR